MQKPKVSVVLSNYNTKDTYLFEAIESLLNQTFLDFEIIIVDDASEIDLEIQLRKFKDNRIKIIKNEINSGLAFSLNKAISISQGEYIARMDTDDICNKNRLKRQVNFLDNNPEIGVVGSGAIFFGSRKRIKILAKKHDDIKAGLVFQNQLIHPSVMIRKSVLDSLSNVYNPKFKTSQDYELWSRLIWKTKFTNLPEILLKYRTHGNQTTTKKADMQFQMANLAREYMLKQGNIQLDNQALSLLNKSTFINPLSQYELSELVKISEKIIVLNRNHKKFEENSLIKALSKNIDRSNYIYARANRSKPLKGLRLANKHSVNSFSILKNFYFFSKTRDKKKEE